MKTIGDGEDLSWTTPFQSSKEPLVSKHLTHSQVQEQPHTLKINPELMK